MKIVEVARIATLTALFATSGSREALFAQGVVSATPGVASIDSINADYDRELIKLEKQRLDALGRLAMSQPKGQAEVTFDAYFRLAIAKNLYADADPIALKVIQSGEASLSVGWLAHLVHIVGQADRGDFEGSLQSLASAIRLKVQDPNAATKDAVLPVGTQASIVDAYYQRLIHGDQIEVARKAMKLIVDNSKVPAIRDLAAQRLKQLNLVGQAAPPISGVDLGGKPYKLEDHKGEVVLVVFWASWCLPNAQEMPLLDHLYRTYHAKGLRVVGINLDSVQDGGQSHQAAMPNIRRFLLEYNVTWPNLINGPGNQDFASAFGITEIPGNVLIGRDGKVRHIDLNGKRLEKAIAETLAQKP
jgi:thiol-disulfide isomerase/thioredoxin